MTQLVVIEQCKPEYSENIFPTLAMFESPVNINKVGDGDVTQINTNSFEGNQCIDFKTNISELVEITTSFNFGTDLDATVLRPGGHILSFKIFDSTSFSTDFDIEFKINLYVNAFLTETFTNTITISPDNRDVWRTYSQTIGTLTDGDIVSFTFEITTPVMPNPNPLLDLQFDGFKLEFDDRNLGIPSVYSPPISYCCSDTKGYVKRSEIGWASYVDTLHTSGSPQSITEGVTPVLLTNNAGTVISSQLPTGVTAFFDQATTKITPVQENDFNSVDIMFKVKNSVLNGFFTVYVDIPTLGTRFEQTFVCPKTAGTEMGVNYSFHHYVSSQFAANGGLIYIVANSGNLQIYDKQYRFAKLINAQ